MKITINLAILLLLNLSCFAQDKTDTVHKTEGEKFISVSAIGLKFIDPKADYQEFQISESEDIEAAMQEAENARLKKELKAQAKDNYVPAPKEKQQISIDNSIFTELLSDTLAHFGFVDTIETIYPDNANTLFVTGTIIKIHEFSIRRKSTGGSTQHFRLKMYMTWNIRNIYGELLDSVQTSCISGKFDGSYGYLNVDQLREGMKSGVTNSAFGLFKLPEYQKNSAILTDLSNTEELLKLQTPSAAVTKKEDAYLASVTIKTKTGHGSGFAVSNDGYILTNFHVVAGDTLNKFPELTVINNVGEEVKGTVVRVSRFNDLALIKVDKTFEKAFKISSEKKYQNLQTIYTIGAPKSTELGQSIAMGVISNDRKAKNLDLIQLGMPINSGNSGGPLFSADGALHGVIVAKLFGWGTEGISFAIPGYKINEYLRISY